MRAEKSRVSRIRSPSSRNELIETEIRQKARRRRAFSFCRQVASPITACDVFSGQYFYGRCSAVQQAGLMPRAMAATLLTRAIESHSPLRPKPRCTSELKTAVGYPVSTRKKKCAYLVTYQHSADQHFEKWVPTHAMIKEM